MDEQHDPAPGPRPGDRDDFGRVYRPHTVRAGCALLGCLLVILASAVLITALMWRVL
ncbi:hypothetical protein ACFZBU_21760 [Embleya sp. NPDC008237]|uniref:hypothetical protein n=1 Tax=Embleya sp. NPDC008237 TaxID=3363978 RepID=UPI0036E599EA